MISYVEATPEIRHHTGVQTGLKHLEEPKQQGLVSLQSNRLVQKINSFIQIRVKRKHEMQENYASKTIDSGLTSSMSQFLAYGNKNNNRKSSCDKIKHKVSFKDEMYPTPYDKALKLYDYEPIWQCKNRQGVPKSIASSESSWTMGSSYADRWFTASSAMSESSNGLDDFFPRKEMLKLKVKETPRVARKRTTSPKPCRRRILKCRKNSLNYSKRHVLTFPKQESLNDSDGSLSKLSNHGLTSAFKRYSEIAAQRIKDNKENGIKSNRGSVEDGSKRNTVPMSPEKRKELQEQVATFATSVAKRVADYQQSFNTVQSFDSPHDSSSGVASDLTSPPSPPKVSTHRDVRQKPPRRSSAMRQHDFDSSSGDSCLNRTPIKTTSFYNKYPIEPKIFLAGSDQGSIDPPSDYSSGNLSSISHRELQDTGQLISCLKRPTRQSRYSPFDYLSDDVVIKIFISLSTEELCRCSKVCRRWYNLAWEPSIWTTLTINNGNVNVDQALKYLTRRLSYDTPYVCVSVQNINLNGCEQLTDKGLQLIANRCPELTNLDLQGCPKISNMAIFEVVSKCTNLERLNLLGSPGITCISLTPEASMQASPLRSKQIFLHFLDMTDCTALEDGGLSIIASHCTNLQYLYLRRCVRITDIGVQYIANYCTLLKELSISDCRRVTDFGVRELSKLESSLRYLSVAKCDKISDVGIKYIAKFCYKLRYLNARGCEAVSDDSIVNITRYCRRLRSLDIGKCDVTDDGLVYLAENCPQLRKLSLKSCESITDAGVIAIAYNMKHLHQLNIQDCHLSVESYRAVKKYCKHCIIEHTNPGFY